MVAYPKDWEEKNLSDIGQVKMCKRIFSHQTRKSGAVPFYKIGTFGGVADAFISMELFREYKNKYPYPEKGDVLISASGSIGRTVIFNGKDSYFQDSNIVWLDVDDSEVYNKFLYYFYESFPWESTEGTTIKRLYNDLILKTKINLPPLSEQQAIAEALSTFDEHIVNLTKLIEKKKAIRDGALEDLVTGKVRLDEFDGEWDVTRLGNIVKVKRGKRVVRRELSERGNIPVFQNSLDPLGYFTQANCPANSTIVIAAGNAGDIGFCNCDFWAADDCYYFEGQKSINQKFLYYCLLFNKSYISSQSRRTSIPRLSRDVLEKIELSLPVLVNEQQAIASVLTAMDEELDNLEREKEKILQMKAGAMDDLLTGKIRLV